MRSNFDLDVSGSKHTYFDALSRREEHDGVRIFALDHFVKKLRVKKHVILGRYHYL